MASYFDTTEKYRSQNHFRIKMTVAQAFLSPSSPILPPSITGFLKEYTHLCLCLPSNLPTTRTGSPLVSSTTPAEVQTAGVDGLKIYFITDSVH